MPDAFSGKVCDAFGAFGVGQMPARPRYPRFQVCGVTIIVFQHFGIVIRFDQHDIGIGKRLQRGFGHNAEIGHDRDLASFAVKRIAEAWHVVRNRERGHRYVADAHVARELVAPALQPAAKPAVQHSVIMNGSPSLRHVGKITYMIGMRVRDEYVRYSARADTYKRSVYASARYSEIEEKRRSAAPYVYTITFASAGNAANPKRHICIITATVDFVNPV